MKKIICIALALFAASFCLPAYLGGEEPMSGWACMQYCWTTPSGESMAIGWKIYYFGFVISNLAFTILVGLSLGKSSTAAVVRWVSLVPLLHVVSWWVINVSGDQTFFHNSIRYGYYVWLAAFGLLTVGLFAAKKSGAAGESLAVKEQTVTLWFPAKTVGYGWGMPTCWQGQVVLVLYLALLFAGALVLMRDPANAGYFFLYLLGLSLVLIFICWWKGESPGGKTDTRD